MCGRFTLRRSARELAEHFALDEVPELCPRYNIAPGQEVAAVRGTVSGGRELVFLRWGLVPAWARDARRRRPLINARSESVHERPSFAPAFRARRCIVPADGFFEWSGRSGAGPRAPFFVEVQGGALFGIAALFEEARPQGALPFASLVLLTTRANTALSCIHPRMPAILDSRDYGRWLAPGAGDGAALRALLRPLADTALRLRPVSARVNRPEHDDPACLAPPPASAQPPLL